MDPEAYLEHQEHENKHWWFLARRHIVSQFLQKNLPKKKHLQILEIGAGTGGNLAMLKKFGELHAMELDECALEFANAKNICPVQKGHLPDGIPFDQKFDVIVMLDVLEHIQDDKAALHTVKSLLKENGQLLLTVPAYQFLWSGHDVMSHHYRRYTRKNLQSLLQKSEFTIRHSTYFNTFLFPIVLAVRIFSKIIKSESQSDVTMPSNFVNQTLKTIFQSESLLLPFLKFPFGVSILTFAENKTSTS